MDRRTLLKYLSIGVAGTSLTTAVQSLASASGGTAAWGYTGTTGPSNWGSLDPAYAVCGTGTRQSPINVNTTQAIDATPTDFEVNYQSFSPTIKNTGKTIQVDCPSGSTLDLDGKTFNLLQFHFHAPAEHTKNTQLFPMEVHFVNALLDAAGNIVELAVIGVFMEVGSYNAQINKIFNNMPTTSGGTNSPSGVSINPEDILPKPKLDVLGLITEPLKYYRYNGSLTTPPCSEIVNWILYDRPIKISQAQLDQFEALYDNIARPVQSLEGRFVLEDKLT
ncbi:carbonic anhydrase [Coleofasciculus chthonoplastes]|uniref:carbonic anhydrase n=1 Tax=Coleofasciculus chthonoplastes TaxID=64178 RepID=UPI0032F1FB70